MNTQNNNVSIGPSTIAGGGTALTTFVLAIIAYSTGDHSAKSVTAIELAGISALSGSITLIGRYFQAHKNVAVTEIFKSAETDLASKSSNAVLTEISKISHDIASIIKNPKEVFDWSKDEEFAHDIDTLATSPAPTTPDADNSKIFTPANPLIPPVQGS